MNKTTIEVTLSRAHKIAERMKTRSTELFTKATGLAGSKSGQVANAAVQAKKIEDQCAEVMRLHAEAERWADQLVEVRDAVGLANAERGISSMLARLEGINRVLAQKKSLVEAFDVDDLSAQELAALIPAPTTSAYDRPVRVRVLSVEAKASLDAEIAVLQRKAFALSDDLAEANAGRVKLSIDEDIAAQVTGA